MKKLAILLMILILALAACGGGDDDSDTDEGTDTEQTTSQTTDDATEEPAEEPTDDDTEDVTEEADATEEADVATEEATEEAMEQSAVDSTEEADVVDAEATEEMDATEEADMTEDMDATEEADMTEEMDATEEADMTEEMDATEEAGGSESTGPVTISGWETLDEGCPTLFQFQHPPNWEITRSGGARVTFNIATDGGVSEGLIEYRGGIAANQIETNYERFANIDTASVVYTMNFDGQEFPVYKDERSGNSGPINYYYFFLPGRNLADNVRITIEPDESGNFPPDEDILQMFSTIVPNSCF